MGAGPAGSAAAMTLATSPGLEVVLVDRAHFPRTKVCGSGLSPWALALLDELGVGEDVRREAYPIRAAVIGSGRAAAIELRGRHEAAVLLRERLDELLVQAAVRTGARLVEGTLVRSALRSDGRVVGVETDAGAIEADAVLDCSGATTRLSRSSRPGRTLHTIMGWYEGVAGTFDAVELYFDPAIRPHYGWVFPESPERVNIGICFAPRRGEPNARERFGEFIDQRLADRMRSAVQVGKLVGHPIATTHRPTALATDGMLIAGEAGRLVDPATAEGIHQALASGRLAGRLVASLLADDRVPTPELTAGYTRAVRREVGRRLLGGELLLGLLRTPVFDFALRFGSHAPVQAALTRALAGA